MITEIKPILPENIEYKDLIEMYSEELGILQREAKELDIPIVIIFEGWYDAFIGEIINRQLLPLDSRGFDFYYTDAPTSSEVGASLIFITQMRRLLKKTESLLFSDFHKKCRRAAKLQFLIAAGICAG